jgi:hypothetical protein
MSDDEQERQKRQPQSLDPRIDELLAAVKAMNNELKELRQLVQGCAV